MRDLVGKCVVVTGAAMGIGLATALAFAKRGARVVLSDRDAAGLEQAQRQVMKLDPRCQAWPCDVTDDASVAALAGSVLANVGPPDVLVNNAGIAYLGALTETPLARWRGTFEVNVFGVVRCVQAFLPAMQSAGGERCLVNVASVAGIAAAPNMAAYVASKHAVVGLSEALAMELDGSGVSVMVVCPGIIDTAIVRAPNSVAASIADSQLERLRRYYVDNGCSPDVVGEGIVAGVLADDAYLYLGPKAKLASVVSRLPKRFARRLLLQSAREIGYVD